MAGSRRERFRKEGTFLEHVKQSLADLQSELVDLKSLVVKLLPIPPPPSDTATCFGENSLLNHLAGAAHGTRKDSDLAEYGVLPNLIHLSELKAGYTATWEPFETKTTDLLNPDAAEFVPGLMGCCSIDMNDTAFELNEDDLEGWDPLSYLHEQFDCASSGFGCCSSSSRGAVRLSSLGCNVDDHEAALVQVVEGETREASADAAGEALLFLNWSPMDKSRFAWHSSSDYAELQQEAATRLQEFWRLHLQSTRSKDEVIDDSLCGSDSGLESDSCIDTELDDDALQVEWLPLDAWRHATGLLNLSLGSIKSYYMWADKGLRDYDARKWFRIIEPTSHDTEPHACHESHINVNPSCEVAQELWDESDLVRFMSEAVQIAQPTRDMQRACIFETLEEVRHKLPYNLYEKARRTFTEML